MTTAERQLNIIKILCRRGHETTQNLADELGVSKRTIQRDIDAISIETPIYMKKGKYEGGVYIDPSFQSDRLYFTDEESELLSRAAFVLEGINSKDFDANDLASLRTMIQKYSKFRK